MIPEFYLKDIINKADPFVRHCFRNWLHLTRKFMVELNNGNSHEQKKNKASKDREDFEKVKMV